MQPSDTKIGSDKLTLGNILLAYGAISAEDLSDARDKALKKVCPLEEILKKEKLITNKLLEEAITSHCQTEEESACTVATTEKNFINSVGPRVLCAVCGKKQGSKICKNVSRFMEKRRVRNALKVARRAENAYLKSLRADQKPEQKDVQKIKEFAPTSVSIKPTTTAKEKSGKTVEERENRKAEEKVRRKAERDAKRKERNRIRTEEKRHRMEEKIQEKGEEMKLREEKVRQRKKELQIKKEEERVKREELEAKKEEERIKREQEELKRREEERVRKAEEEKKNEEARKKKEEEMRQQEEEKMRKKKEASLAKAAAVEEKKKKKEEENQRKVEEIKRKKEEKRKEREEKIAMRKAERQAKRQARIQKAQEKSATKTEPAAQKGDTEAIEGVSTVLVDKPQEVTVAAPQGIVREVQPTIVQSASIDERQVFEEEKKRLLARIEELEKGAPVTEVKMDADEERKAIAAERAALEAERRALAEERKNAPVVSAAPTASDVDTAKLEAKQRKIEEERASLEKEKAAIEEEKKSLKKVGDVETPDLPAEARSAKAGRASPSEKKATAESERETAALKKEKQELEAKLKILEEEKKEWEEYEAKLKAQEAVFKEEISKAKESSGKEVVKEVVVEKASGDKSVDKLVAEDRAKLDAEKQMFEEQKKKWEEERKKVGAEAVPAGDKEAFLAEARKELEEKFQKQKVRFDVEREELIKEVAKAKAGVSEGTELTRIKDEAKQEAEAELQRERTKWEIEKEKIKQQAIAEAESDFLSKMKGGGGMFGGKQKDALNKEITKWKEKAEKLERERTEVEKTRVLNEEQERIRTEEQKVEQENLRLQRERISKEKKALEMEATHEELLEEQQEALEKERMELEEARKTRDLEKKASKKAKKKDKKEAKKKDKKKGEKGGEEKPSINVGEILVAQNYLEKEELERAEKEAFDRKVSIENILREEGLVTKEIIQNAIAEHYKMPFIDVSAEPPDTAVVEILPEELSMGLRATAIERKDDGTLIVATHNPERGEEIKAKIVEAVPEVTKVEMVYTSKDAIDSALSFYNKPLETRFQSIIEERKKIAPEIIEEIFADAIQLGASDIHFEPQEKIVIVRFRVDGVMHEAGRLPKQYYEGVVNRIKIAGNMRIDEHFAAQDGAIRWKQGDRAMDVRVSIVPIVDGEKIVMRLLSEYVRTLTLRDLGFSSTHLENLVKSAHKPFGMILTTGPTGSGKSTTLYGLLKIRNSPDVNISTIEDPVEYKIPGINHIQVNVKANLTFERGLRALVRQDPDIILVGEIRDNITAQISVNAALTGHLLFSTLHANDAATAVPRLLEMGIEPYLLASTLELIIAQRLMRRTCKNCRYSYSLPRSEAKQLFTHGEHYLPDEDEIMLYKGKGCDTCGGTGFKGRVGVYELMVVTPEVEDMITNRRTSGEINTVARNQGMLTLFEDGLQKVLSGLSTIDELLRVAAPPDPLASDVTPKINVQEEKES